MTEYLKTIVGVEKTVTFGSIEGRYDVVVNQGDTNKVVHMVKKIYEPVKWGKFFHYNRQSTMEGNTWK
jgi:hypothetical protein